MISAEELRKITDGVNDIMRNEAFRQILYFIDTEFDARMKSNASVGWNKATFFPGEVFEEIGYNGEEDFHEEIIKVFTDKGFKVTYKPYNDDDNDKDSLFTCSLSRYLRKYKFGTYYIEW